MNEVHLLLEGKQLIVFVLIPGSMENVFLGESETSALRTWWLYELLQGALLGLLSGSPPL